MVKSNTVEKNETTSVEDVKINPIDNLFKLSELTEKYKTKSAIIRFLTSEGHTRSHIAKFMNIRYQHVRNVQVQDIEKSESK